MVKRACFQHNCEVWRMCVWRIVVEGHNGKHWKVGNFLVVVFPFTCGRIGRGHDIRFFLDSGLCRAFPFLLCGGMAGEWIWTEAETHAHSLRYAYALFRSLKKSEASVAVRPVMEGSFLSG